MRIITATCLAFLTALTPAQAGLRVNEISTGTTDWLELANFGGVTIHLGGYKVFCGGNQSGAFQFGQFIIPANVNIAPNQLIVITDDATLASPTVPSGGLKLYSGFDIIWSNVPGGNGSGQCTLTDANSLGVDTVRWGTPLQDLSLGASFSGTVSLGTIMRRTSNGDTNSSTDWFSTSASGASAGAFNLGQTFVPVLQLTGTTTGLGDLSLTVTTLTPAVPSGEIFNFVSLVDTVPDGSGPLFGVDASALQQALTPLSPANPFHTPLDANGHWNIFAPVGSLPHLHLEVVSILLEGGLITRTSGVVALDI